MNDGPGARRHMGAGRLDPTVRALLRAFLSPAVADRYASALQPIAVADRDAALAGAVSTLRARFFVLPEELAVALVEDAAWSVADVATMLGMPTLEVRAALREAAGAATPRIGATAPQDLDEHDGEAAIVDAMLADLPVRRRDAATVAAEPDEDPPVDVELTTRLPAHVGLPSLEARIQRADRVQRLVVNATVVLTLLLAGLALDATRTPGSSDVALPEAPVATTAPSPAPSGTASPAPSPSPSSGPAVGPPVVAEARFVASVDPETGAPGPSLTRARTTDDPRLWVRFAQLPERNVLLDLTFTAPSGRSTVRPVLLTDRTPLVSVRLPDELGRAPGRYAVRIDAEDMARTVVELEILEEPSDDPTT